MLGSKTMRDQSIFLKKSHEEFFDWDRQRMGKREQYMTEDQSNSFLSSRNFLKRKLTQ